MNTGSFRLGKTYEQIYRVRRARLVRSRIRISNSKYHLDPLYRRKIAESLLGHSVSEETKKRISESRATVVLTANERTKLKESVFCACGCKTVIMRRPSNPKAKRRWLREPHFISGHNRVGKVQTKRHRERIGKANKGSKNGMYGVRACGKVLAGLRLGWALRGNPSKFEKLLLHHLRAMNLRVEPQRRLAHLRYFIDLYLPDYKLAVEVDGHPSHYNDTRKIKADKRRDTVLKSLGISTLRLRVNEMPSGKRRLDLCLKKIGRRLARGAQQR